MDIRQSLETLKLRRRKSEGMTVGLYRIEHDDHNVA